MKKIIFISAVKGDAMRRTWIILSILFLATLSIQTADAEIYSSISGRVIGEDTGKGVGGVTVEAIGKKRYSAESNEDGTYIIQNVLSGGKYALHFSAMGTRYITELPKIIIDVPLGKNVVNVNYVLKVGGGVSGTVYKSDGVTPLNRVGVSVMRENTPDGEVSDATLGGALTDETGKYVVMGMTDGDYTVWTMIPGIGVIRKDVTIEKGKTVAGVDFIFRFDDITGVSGYVRSSVDNKPIINAKVDIDIDGEEIGYAYTDDTGRYSIVGIKHGIYSVGAFLPVGGFIEKKNILIEKGKSTEVNFEF